MTTCGSCGAENPAEMRFCGKCGTALGALAASGEVRRTVTVVFTDVTGSTAMGERMDPESLRRVMSRYFAAMREVLERHGGTVEKFIGDAVVAVFGVPTIHEDDALRAVRAATEMRGALATLNEQLLADFGITIAVRTGVNTGDVVAGDPVADGSFVTGEAVNVAARLEQAAAPGEILLGEATHRLVRAAVRVEAVEPMVLKGKSTPTMAVRLLEVLEGVEPYARRLDSPMVGRDRQLEALRRAFDDAATDNACHLFTVLGTAGVGKSRLLEEFVKGVGGQATILRGRCLPYGRGITFWPVAEVVKAAASLSDFDEPDTVERGIAELLGGVEHAPAIAARITEVIGVTSGSAPAEEAQWAVRRLLEVIGQRGPLVVVFDDLHWAESSFLDLIDHVADASRDAAILLICTARPEFLDSRAGWAGGKLNATSILLEPLTDAQSESLIANLVGSTDLAEEVRSRIVQAAGGNPLFVEQMLGMLIDDGLIESVDGRWIVTADHLAISVPPTIAALISARLDRLEPAERDLLGRAAVVGKVFYLGAVVDLGPESEAAQVDERLRSLVRKDLVRSDRTTLPGEDAFRFRHILVQESAYGALPKATRAMLHERFADWLERAAGDRVEEQEEILGYHLERAYRYREELGAATDEHAALARRAAERLAAAGRRAAARSDIAAADNLFSRGSSLLPPDDPFRIELILDLASVVQDVDHRDRIWTEAIDRARDLADDRLLAHALVQRWLWKLILVKDADAARVDADWAMGVFERAGDERGLARAWSLRGLIGWVVGQAGVEEAAIEEVLRHARAAGDFGEESEAFSSLSRDLVRGPTSVEAGIRRCEELLTEHANRRSVEASMFHALAHLQARRGEFERARELAQRYRDFYRDTGQNRDFELAAEVVYDVEMLAGDPAAAERVLRVAHEALRTGEDRYFDAFLSRAICAQEHWDEAEAHAEYAAASGRFGDALGKGSLGRVRAHQGQLEEAESIAREAVEQLAGTDFLIDRADVLTDLADVLLVAGRGAEAAETLDQAIALYEQKGDIVSLARARAGAEQIRRSISVD